MTTLTLVKQSVHDLRAYLETGEMLEQALIAGGLRPMLQLHIDDDGAQILLVVRADAPQVQRLLADRHITHEPVDFVLGDTHTLASYKVSLFGHELAVVVDHIPAARVLAP